MTALYSLRSTPKEGEYIVTKFNPDYNVDSLYALNATECMCPAGHKPKCRHRTMLPLFLAHNHVDDGWFLDWDTRLWRHPVSPQGEMSYEHDGVTLVHLSATLADPLVLPAPATESSEPKSEYEKWVDIINVDQRKFATDTPMMDNIRKLAEADPTTQEPSPAPAAPAPAPEVSRSVGVGAPLKRRRITI